MMKILIDNEEVVSNSNLQIKEEMLSTSSTILKNCYPATWEEDKDYTSRYYFPKDYSKCKIIDETYYPEIIGTRVSGTSLNITYDSNLNWDFEQIQGNTQQTGTPTPDSPVPIQTVTGRQVVSDRYVNIFDFSVGGTAGQYLTNTGEVATGADNLRYSDYIELTQNTPYLYFGGIDPTYMLNAPAICFYDSTKTFISGESYLNRLSGSFVVPTGAKYIRTSYRTFYTSLQLKEEKQYEINLGKNLFDKSKITSITNGSISGDIITSNAISSNYGGVSSTISGLTLEAGTYYISLKVKRDSGTSGNKLTRITLVGIDASQITMIDNPNITNEYQIYSCRISPTTQITLTNIGIQLQPTNVNAVMSYTDIMISKDSNTSYSPYFTPIELNKIGNYQDSIKKSSGKNLFDKNNVLNGALNASTGELSASDNFRTIYFKCKPSTTYTIQKIVSNRFTIGYSAENNITLPKTLTNINALSTSLTNYTFTTNNDTEYVYIMVSKITDDTANITNILNSIQIELGSTATSYEPYLPKGTWYIENKVGSVVLNGSETWGVDGTLTNTIRFRIATSYFPNTIGQSYTQHTRSDYFVFSVNYNNDTPHYYIGGINANSYFFMPKTLVSNVTDFKTWLSNNNVKVIYLLASPTYTEITNEELLGQLNTIENASLFDGINNIIVSSANLPGTIQIYYNYQHEHTTQDLLFCGCVKNTGNISLNPREPHYVDLQVLDFKDLLSTGETLDFVINNKTITQAITQVVDAISDYGFVVGDIKVLSPNDIINAYSTLNKTPYDVFQYIADITQSRWTTRVIDENTIAIDFYDPSLMPEAQPIEDTEEYYCNNEINSITFNYSTNDYRNKQIMTSDEVYSNITQAETIIADGYRDSFMCQNKIGVITNIKVNGIDSTFTTKTEYEMGISADFIYTPGEMTFTANQIYSAGTIISIEYYAIVKGREIVLNTSEITRVEDQIGRKGIISRYENRNDTTSSQELIKIGQSYIKYKGNAEITLRIVTQKELFNVGQIVSYNAPLEDLSTDYMVKSKTIDMYINAEKIFYIYELSNNFNSENAINYFDNQRAKNQGNLDTNETITRNIDIEATALIQFYDYTIEEVQVGTNTTLDFALDSVAL